MSPQSETEQLASENFDPFTIAALKANTPAYQRTPQEISKLQRVIATLFGLSSGRFGFNLLPHPENWACGFSPDKEARVTEALQNDTLDLEGMSDEDFSPDAFYYPLEELRTLPEEEIYGVTHHESAHAQYTSFRLLILGHKIAEKEGKLPTTWGLILNGVEDGRINRMKSSESDAARSQIGALYERWEVNILENISTQSLVRQYTLNAVYCWLKGGPIPDGMDPRVKAAFADTKDAVFRYINEDSREESFKILRDEIWPRAKELEDEARKDQELRELKREKKSLWDKLKDRMNGGEADERSNQPLPPEEREKLERELEALPQDQKDSIRKRAKEELDKRQAEEANGDGIKGFSYDFDKESGKHRLTQRPTPNEEDEKLGESLIEDALDAERERAADAAKRERKNIEMRRNGFNEDEESEFNEFTSVRSSIMGLKNNFMRSLRDILPRETLKDFGGEYNSGPRITNKSLVKRAPVKDSRFYQRRTQEITGDPLLNVEIIIDNSVSMEGAKIEEAKRAVLLTLEVLSDLGLPSSVKRFASEYDWIQKREAAYSDPRARVKPKVLSGLNAKGGGTNIGDPLEESKNAVSSFKLKFPKTLCLIVVISDGDANVGKTGEELKELISEIGRKAVVVNIILSGSASDLEKSRYYFGERNSVECGSVSELPNSLIRVLKGAFERALRRSN